MLLVLLPQHGLTRPGWTSRDGSRVSGAQERELGFWTCGQGEGQPQAVLWSPVPQLDERHVLLDQEGLGRDRLGDTWGGQDRRQGSSTQQEVKPPQVQRLDQGSVFSSVLTWHHVGVGVHHRPDPGELRGHRSPHLDRVPLHRTESRTRDWSLWRTKEVLETCWTSIRTTKPGPEEKISDWNQSDSQTRSDWILVLILPDSGSSQTQVLGQVLSGEGRFFWGETPLLLPWEASRKPGTRRSYCTRVRGRGASKGVRWSSGGGEGILGEPAGSRS